MGTRRVIVLEEEDTDDEMDDGEDVSVVEREGNVTEEECNGLGIVMTKRVLHITGLGLRRKRRIIMDAKNVAARIVTRQIYLLVSQTPKFVTECAGRSATIVLIYVHMHRKATTV